VRKADNHTTFICRLSNYSANTNPLEPQGPVQPCTGIALEIVFFTVRCYLVTLCTRHKAVVCGNCSGSSVYCVTVCVSLLPHVYCVTVCVPLLPRVLCYCVCIFVTSCVLFYYVCIAVLHTLVDGLLARSQYSEGPATGHLDTGFPRFPCIYKQTLRWFPAFQVATTCFSCSPPDLNLLDPYFIFMYMRNNHCHRASAHLQLNILL